MDNNTTQEIPYGFCQCGCGQKTRIATRNRTRDSMVKGQPLRFIQGHSKKLTIKELFWDKVDKRGPNDCWLWLGPPNNSGYGSCYDGDRSKGAHCVSWELHNGPIPDGKRVCHNCPGGDNPLCCNPAHLWLGTQADNLRDMRSKGRQPSLEHIHGKGEAHHRAKLTEADVQHIRAMAARGVRHTTLAKQFNVTKTHIGYIVHRKTWAHVT